MAFKTNAMRYLGGISGSGTVTLNGKKVAMANFDLDGYFRPMVGVTGSGEIQLPRELLEGLFGRTDLQLLTDHGLLLDLRFSDSTLPPASDVAHVDVKGSKGSSPTAPADWRQ